MGARPRTTRWQTRKWRERLASRNPSGRYGDPMPANTRRRRTARAIWVSWTAWRLAVDGIPGCIFKILALSYATAESRARPSVTGAGTPWRTGGWRV